MWESKKGDADYEDVFSGTALSVRCYESHPTLKVGKGILCGGSSSHPVVKDADIYVSLQAGSASGRSSDPWDPPATVEVFYAISDMHAPTNVPRFQKMVTWLCNQLQNGKKVHVGCMGGHGRTGLVLSAILAEALGKKDAIQYVRKHYCKKAVESKSQTQFLMTYYGVTEVVGAKEGTSWASSKGKLSGGNFAIGTDLVSKVAKPRKLLTDPRAKVFEPMDSARSLWKLRKRQKPY